MDLDNGLKPLLNVTSRAFTALLNIIVRGAIISSAITHKFFGVERRRGRSL